MAETAKHVYKFSDIDDQIVCYFKNDDDGFWYLHLPDCGLGNLANHKIEEHEDGTISVTPSILVTGHEDGKSTQRHGYLTRGVWNEC